MSPRVLLLIVLSACATGDTLPGSGEPASRPQIVESSAPSSEPKAALPEPPEPAPTATPAQREPPPATPATPAKAPDVDLAPRIVGATGPDAETFYRAEAMRGQGDLKAMREALLTLVKDHPTSKFMPHAFLMLGDEFFNKGDFPGAASFFEKALTYPNDDTGAYASYRLALCRQRQGNDQEALAGFVTAAERAQRVATDQGRALVRASLRDSAPTYARVGKIDRAAPFYTKVTAGTGIPLEEVLREVAIAAISRQRRDEVATVCKAEGMPAWCAGPLDAP